MTPDQSDINSNIKCLIIGEVKLSYEPFLMDVLCSKKKKLSILDYVSHVVVRAIAPVTDVDILRSGYNGMSVNNGAKGTKFVLLVNRLQKSGCIQMRIKV